MNYSLEFEQIEQSLLDNFNNSKLYHSLLFLGNVGIGKFSLALSLASKIILFSSSNKNEDLLKIQSRSHPDLLIIRKEKDKQSISIDAVQKLHQYLSLSAAISEHRVIIIDAIDDLNRTSNNALLKILEEPPQNVFLFAINHNTTKLMDTIKSRCQIIKINNPNYQEFQSLLRMKVDKISDEEVRILAKISDNSIGLAMEMHKYRAIDLYAHLKQLTLNNNTKDILDLAKKIANNDELWNIFEKLVIFYLYERLHQHNKEIFFNSKNQIFFIVDKINNLLYVTKSLNLDKSQSIINIFNIIENAKS
jgi:DNA polymerase-3 subunit delta'